MESKNNSRLSAIEAILERTAIEAERRNVEFDRRIKESKAAADKRQAAADVEMQKIRDAQAETDRLMKQSSADFDRRTEALDRLMKQSSADYDRRMINFEKTMGSWSNNHGSFAEEYFFNSFENGRQNFFGEKFDDIDKKVSGLKRGFRDEYDIVLTNGKSVCIIEVKFKAHQDHIAKVLNKAVTFRENFPYYATHQVYLGYASLSFDDIIEQECIANGIAIKNR